MHDDAPKPLPWPEFLRELGAIRSATGATVPTHLAWEDQLDAQAEVAILASPTEVGICWYFGSRSGRRHRHLRKELVAFLGPTYSSYEGRFTGFRDNDPLEQLLLHQFARRVIRIEVTEAVREKVTQRIALFQKLSKLAPERSRVERRTASRILADFEEALQHGDDALAADCILSLKRDGLVDANNLLFLEVRRDEAFGRWPQVLSRIEANRHTLLSGIRPSRVHEALLRSVHAIKIAPFERNQDSHGALAAFRDDVAQNYGELLISRRNYRCAEARTLFALQSLARAETASDSQAHHSLDRAEIPEWLQSLIPTPLAPQTQPPERDLSAAQRALGRSDFDEAIDIARDLEATTASAKLLLQAYGTVGTLEVSEIALRHFHALSDSERAELRSSNPYRSLVERLAPKKEFATKPAEERNRVLVPNNWLSWAKAVEARPDWTDAYDLAAAGAHQWNVSQLAGEWHDFNEVIEGLDATGQARVLESLPHLLSSLLEVESTRTLRKVLETLILLHLQDDAPGDAFFPTLIDLADLTLRAGASKEQYDLLITETQKRISGNAGPRDFNALLDLLDVLLASGSPEPELRSALAVAISNLFGRFSQRVSVSQRLLLTQLLNEAESPLPTWLTPKPGALDDDTLQSPLARLGAKKIALYSLNERALKTVTKAIKAAAPELEVRSFSNKAGGDPSLKNAAETFDVFVIATASAKHAATGFIEQNRDSAKTILRPAGKGSSSMLRELENYAREAA